MDIEDHIPQDDEPHWSTVLHNLIEEENYHDASELLTDTMLDFFYAYRDIPELFGLLTQANHIKVTELENQTVLFDTRRKCMYIPHRVAHKIESAHDLACLMLIERARLIVNRTAHTYLPAGMDITQRSHKAVFEMALSCWSVALSRCYCASILPERLNAVFADLQHNLMHGLDPDATTMLLQASKLPSVAKIYTALYKQGGQEQYHYMLNRIAPEALDTISFNTVLPYFWQDFKDKAPSNEEIEAMMQAGLVANPEDGEDDKLEEAIVAIMDAGKGGDLEAVPTANIDVESELDRYLADYVQASVNTQWGDPTHGLQSAVPDTTKMRAAFSGMTHTVMLESMANDDQPFFGSVIPPDHPTAHDLAQYMQGFPPSLWETRMSPSIQDNADVKYGVYFDISCSMYSWLSVVRALISQLGNYVHPDHIYGFSTQVEKIDMSGSFLLTTGGTHIDSATKHARENNVTHMICITDLEDHYRCDTRGIEHIILIGTDTRWTSETFDVSKTVFAGHDVGTKIDFQNLKYKDLVKKVSEHIHSFNTDTKTVKEE